MPGWYNQGRIWYHSVRTLSTYIPLSRKEHPLPKVNYKHNKRQKDIAKKKKHDEKLRRRQEKKQEAQEGTETQTAPPMEQAQGPQDE